MLHCDSSVPFSEHLTSEEILLRVDEVVGGFVHFDLTLP